MDYSKKTIFVSVASYRDFYCSRTLESMYKNATHPENLYAGICLQNKEGDEDCVLPDDLQKYSKNITTIRMKNYEAKGPTWARYLCTTLFNDQDYFFQIDSHTLFEVGWDVTLMAMIDEIKQNTESKDVVLSHYPPNYEDHSNKEKNKNVVDTICQSFFNEKGMVSFLGASPIDMSKDKYVQTPHIAAGMFFCEGKCIREVPYDPNLPNLFVGEEILHSARVWTAGYDIYSPTQVTVYHLYTRADQPHVWDDKKTFDDTDAFNKAKYILGLQDNGSKPIPDHVKENIDKYGLGTKRTLQEFFDFAGIDPKNKTIYKNFCPKPHTIKPEKGVPKEGFAEDEKGDEIEGFTGINDAYGSQKPSNISSYVNKNVLYFFLFLLLLLIGLSVFKKINILENFSRFNKKNLIFNWKNILK
jgi:hypothetical protein